MVDSPHHEGRPINRFSTERLPHRTRENFSMGSCRQRVEGGPREQRLQDEGVLVLRRRRGGRGSGGPQRRIATKRTLSTRGRPRSQELGFMRRAETERENEMTPGLPVLFRPRFEGRLRGARPREDASADGNGRRMLARAQRRRYGSLEDSGGDKKKKRKTSIVH